MKKQIIVGIQFVLLLTLMCGCSNTPNSSTVTSSSAVADSSEVSVEEETPNYTVVDIKDVPNQKLTSVYIDVKGTGSCIMLENNYNDTVSYEDDLNPVMTDVETNSDSIFYELSSENGDRLITTISADAECTKVTDQGFIGGTKTDEFVKDTEVNGVTLATKDIKGELENILSPDGIEVLSLNASPNMENHFGIANVFFSHDIETVVYGSYRGTKWVDGSFEIDIPVYIAETTLGKRKELPQEKTKDGYFVIDCSTLPKGDYIIWSGGAGNLIRIV